MGVDKVTKENVRIIWEENQGEPLKNINDEKVGTMVTLLSTMVWYNITSYHILYHIITLRLMGTVLVNRIWY